MTWAPSDILALVKLLVFFALCILLLFVPGFYYRKELKTFIKNLKKVDGRVGTNGFGIGLSSENKLPDDSHSSPEEARPTASTPTSNEDQVTIDEQQSFGDIIEQIKNDGVNVARKSFEQYIKDKEQDESLNMLKSLFLFRLFLDGNDQKALAEFQELYNTHTDDKSRQYIASFWARCYTKIQQHEKAQEILLNARSDISSPESINYITIDLAKSYNNFGDYPKSISTLTTRIKEQKDRHNLARLYKALSEIESTNKNDMMAALCFEKQAELTPEDSEVLFDAAYKLSQTSINSASLHYYNILLNIDPKHQTALNNIGVLAAELELNIKAVEFQSRSSELNESLAFANLGLALLNAGFIDSAKKMAEQGLRIDPPHNNNYILMEKIQSKINKENSDWAEYISKSGNQLNNIRKYRDAYYANIKGNDCPFLGDWFDQNNNQFTVTNEGQTIHATWDEPHSIKNYSSGLIGSVFGGSSAIIGTTTYDLSGSFSNNSAIVSITTEENPQRILYIPPQNYYKLLSYIDEQTGNWIVFSTDLKKQHEVTFKKVNRTN